MKGAPSFTRLSRSGCIVDVGEPYDLDRPDRPERAWYVWVHLDLSRDPLLVCFFSWSREHSLEQIADYAIAGATDVATYTDKRGWELIMPPETPYVAMEYRGDRRTVAEFSYRKSKRSRIVSTRMYRPGP